MSLDDDRKWGGACGGGRGGEGGLGKTPLGEGEGEGDSDSDKPLKN